MFNNVGEKLQGVAGVLFVLGLLGSLGSGIAILSADEDLVLWGILVIVFGAVSSYVLSLVVQGFGTIVEKTEGGAVNLSKEKKQNDGDGEKVSLVFVEKGTNEQVDTKENANTHAIKCFLEDAKECKRVSELLELWMEVELEKTEMTEQITERLVKAAEFERDVGFYSRAVWTELERIREKLYEN